MPSQIVPPPDVPYFDRVVRGEISGASVVHKFGRNPTTASGTWETVWTVSSLYTFQTAASAVEAFSGSGNDSAGGTGAQKIMVEGLDETWAAASEEITMAGVSASTATTTTFIRIFRAYVTDVGTYQGGNAGTITIRDSGAGATRAQIPIDGANRLGQTQMAMYTVPLGKQAFIRHVVVTVESTKAADFALFQRRNADDATTPFTGKRLIAYMDGVTEAFYFNDVDGPFGPYPAKTDLWFEVKASAVNTEVTADFELLVIDA